MADFVARLLRTLFMLALGVFVVALALFLLGVTLALVLVSLLWGLLTGRRPTARASWARFQQSAASTVWQRYRQGAGWPQGGTPGPRADTTDVVDVDYREARSRTPADADDPGRIGH